MSKGVLVLALCVTLGFHWALLQSVAWVGMIVNYSRQSSLRVAVCKTFDGQHPCALCKLVKAGKQDERKPEARQDTTKLDLFAERAEAFEFPSFIERSFVSPLSVSTRSESPPLPPPRTLLG